LKPGACELERGACESKPGACESKPGACESKPGACESKPGACELEPGACESKPGACELEPGACELEPGACESKPETCESRPAPCNFRAGYARGVLDSWRETGGYGRKPFVAARSPQGRSATHGDLPTPKPCAALPDVGSSPCFATTPCLAANPQPADRGGLIRRQFASEELRRDGRVGEFARKGIGGGEQRFLVHAGRAAEAVGDARFAGIDGARRAGDSLQIEAQRIEQNLLRRRRAAILPRLLDVEIADGLRQARKMPGSLAAGGKVRGIRVSESLHTGRTCRDDEDSRSSWSNLL
jgi:hypothetical protein